MAEISASMVKELRERTGAGMMDCKKALVESGGDLEKAVDELRKSGQAKADKKGSRATKEGLVFAKVDGPVGALVELGCETDFVARNDDFRTLGEGLATLVHQGGAAVSSGDPGALSQATCPTTGRVVGDVLTEAIAKLGENMGIARFVRVDAGADGGPGTLASYIHPPGKIGVLVELHASKAETLAKPEVQELGRDLAMQIAFSNPLGLDRSSVPDETVARERAIYLDQVKAEGKPENIAEKIIVGKLNKFYQEVCLLEQPFVKDKDLTITKLIEQVGKQAGDELKLTNYIRMAVGEGVEETAEA